MTAPYRLGRTYVDLAGRPVTFVGVSNEGTSYETMCDAAGVHRYTRRDHGRVTGTDHRVPDDRNVPPPIWEMIALEALQ